jgi:hypothetical protein
VRIFGTLLGAALIFLVLLDTFETILQPRRVTAARPMVQCGYSECVAAAAKES